MNYTEQEIDELREHIAKLAAVLKSAEALLERFPSDDEIVNILNQIEEALADQQSTEKP